MLLACRGIRPSRAGEQARTRCRQCARADRILGVENMRPRCPKTLTRSAVRHAASARVPFPCLQCESPSRVSSDTAAWPCSAMAAAA